MKNLIKILKFKIQNNIFGIDLNYVKEVGKISDFFKLPSKVKYLEGLFNLRGSILPLINLGKRTNIKYEFNFNKNNIFILVNDSQYKFGIFADKIVGINMFKDTDILNNSLEDNKSKIIEKIINENGNIILLINVKSIINPEDFKYKKRMIFKTVEEFKKPEDIESEIKSKISFTIFKFDEYIFAVKASCIKQLLDPLSAKLNFYDLESLVIGNLEYNDKIIPVLNLKKILGINIKLSKDLNDYYIAIVETNNKIMALLVYYSTEFVEIEENNILHNENILENRSFLEKCFKLENKIVKIINCEKLINYLLTMRAIEK